ncbi:MAG: PAS domain S-box protein [Labilithrix sp.]|nr:PAS domain S-box protein [Labilithrix sp.]MCW5813037.1 PAS domain S-box protein [Labilithrix sp.]
MAVIATVVTMWAAPAKLAPVATVLIAATGTLIVRSRQQRELEARVEERTRELTVSREEYRQLLETTQAIPFRMAPESLRFTYVGPQAVAIVGHPIRAWTDTDFLERHVHAEDLADLRRALGSVAEGTHREVELRLAAAGGKELVLRGIVQTLLDAESRPFLSGIFLDVTARHRLEAELRSAQKLESLGRLAAGIAHEINTPVQFVADSVHYIKSTFPAVSSVIESYREAVSLAPPDVMEKARDADESADTDFALENVPIALDNALDGLQRIGHIVKSLKDFSQPDRTEKSAVDLNACIRSTLAIAAPEYAEVAELQTELGELAPVHCHGGEVNQVLLDLIVNAAHAVADANHGAGTRGRIKVRTWQDDGWAHVCVRDTGNGIPVAIRDKIFDPFFTTKEVGRGTGQSLAIARRIIVDKHGGELTFETEVGRGTAFMIRLPAARRLPNAA